MSHLHYSSSWVEMTIACMDSECSHITQYQVFTHNAVPVQVINVNEALGIVTYTWWIFERW